MKCENVIIKRRRLCLGDLNKKIKLLKRKIVSPDNIDEYDYQQDFIETIEVWASIQTISGKDMFDGSELIGTATHIFYLKYIDIDSNDWMIEYKNKFYRIYLVDNMDENDEFLKLYCSVRGDINSEVNRQ